MKIDDFFDRGFYINLERRPDRNEQFIKEMDNIVPNEFLSRVLGIDSNMCPSIEYKHHFCSLAFYHIIAKSYSLGYKRIVIFEDDFKFYNTEDYEGIGNIEKALNQLSTMDAWDIIYFGGYPSGNFEKI